MTFSTVGPAPRSRPSWSTWPSESVRPSRCWRKAEREAVLAFYWQGLTHAEAAVELGTSPGAVKARLHQARAALAPLLAPRILTDKEVRTMTSTANANWVDVEVVEVRRASGDDPARRLHVVVLKEHGGVRHLPIYTGPAEAVALACTLEAVETPRPMLHQLAASLLGAAGSGLAEVRITRLAESTFYALVVIDGAVGRVEVDARPSDALNLALACGAPIRVDARLLDDPEAMHHTAWEGFPTRESELVAEAQESQQGLLLCLTNDETRKQH